jgi:hypothetical protein
MEDERRERRGRVFEMAGSNGCALFEFFEVRGLVWLSRSSSSPLLSILSSLVVHAVGEIHVMWVRAIWGNENPESDTELPFNTGGILICPTTLLSHAL